MPKRPIATECLVCNKPCAENNSLICAENHVTCYACVVETTKEWCSASGQFCVEFRVHGHQSAVGDWPCVMFSSGQCSVGALPQRVMERAIFDNEEAWARYTAARERLVAGRALNDLRTREETERKEREKATALIRAHQDVLHAMHEGQGVHCPECHLHCQKDDNCIHMTCSQCQSRFCYWCGRSRNRCHCDRGGLFMEQRVGWSEYAREGETPARGALLEFHRRKIAVGVRSVKDSLPVEIWQQMQITYPDLLKDVLPNGRHVAWSEIDTAVMPTTTEEWKPPAAENHLIQGEARVLRLDRVANVEEFQCIQMNTTPNIPERFRGKVGRRRPGLLPTNIVVDFREFHPEFVANYTCRPDQCTDITDQQAWALVTPNPSPPLPEGIAENDVVHVDVAAVPRSTAQDYVNLRPRRLYYRVKGAGPEGIVRVQRLCWNTHENLITGADGPEIGVPIAAVHSYPFNVLDPKNVLRRIGGEFWVQVGGARHGWKRYLGSSTIDTTSNHLLHVPYSRLIRSLTTVQDAFPLNTWVRLMPKATPHLAAGERRGNKVSDYQGKLGQVVGYQDGCVRVDFSTKNSHLQTVYRWPPVALILHQDATTTFDVGARVRVCEDAKRLKTLSTRHGGFKLEMMDVRGREGTVLGFHPSGDLNVQFIEPPVIWRLNPEALTAVESEAVAPSD